MREYAAEDIIRGIARKNSKVINFVYDTCYPDIRKLILSNSGNEHDVKDIFQDALLLVFQKITGQGLELKVKFKTYLYSVCRFLWLQELEKRAGKPTGCESMEEILEEKGTDQKKAASEQRIYEKHFRELNSECQKVLNMYFQKASMEEITVVMGYKNMQIAKDKKFRCKKSLMTKIYNNPEYKLLENEIYLAG